MQLELEPPSGWAASTTTIRATGTCDDGVGGNLNFFFAATGIYDCDASFKATAAAEYIDIDIDTNDDGITDIVGVDAVGVAADSRINRECVD